MDVRNVSNMDDIIDSRDAVLALDALKDEWASDPAGFDSEEALEALEEFVDELNATFGEQEVEFGITLVRDTHWDQYAEEYADEVMEIPNEMASYFDYDKFAEDLQQDYTEVQFDSIPYYGRG